MGGIATVLQNRYHGAVGRPSHVRDAIAELIADSDRHDWTIDDVAQALAEAGVAADPSSVFRGLVRLSEDGAIERVELGDGRLRFEASGDHHEHVRCESCGSVEAVPGCLAEQAIPQVERHTGFVVTAHRLLFSGLCRRCARAGA